MNLRTTPITGSYRVVLILQVIAFIVAMLGVVAIILAIRNNYPSSAFMIGLFLSLLGSASGVLLTLFSMRHH